jgi:protein tyrosine/serine phosphatase
MHPSETAPPKLHSRQWRRIAYVAGTLALLVVGFFVLWNNGLRDYLYPKNFGIVEPGQLYRSGQISRWQIEPTLKNNNIKVIIALSGHGGRAADLQAESDACQQLGIDREVFPLGGDGTGQIQQYAQAIAAIDRAKKSGKPVLVHCIAGAQRTGGVIATYEILVEHRSPAEAFAQMRSFGHDPTANPHLLEYLNKNMEPLATLLVGMHVIDKVPSPVPVIGSQEKN